MEKPTGIEGVGMNVSAYACHVHGMFDGHETIYNATTRGQAKRLHHQAVSEPWPNVKYTDIRARKVGGPHTSEGFIRNAIYRGMPDARCGQIVQVGDERGVLVGHNSSANFDVLFNSGKYSGQVMNVHPSEIRIVR